MISSHKIQSKQILDNSTWKKINAFCNNKTINDITEIVSWTKKTWHLDITLDLDIIGGYLRDWSNIEGNAMGLCRPKDNMESAYKWLRDNGYGDLIKNEIAVPFGRGEDERANDLLKTLVNNGYEPNQKTVVHPQTLKAFVKEQLESGKELPLDLLGAYAGQKTVIKKGGK